MKFTFALLLSFIIGLTGCSSINKYVNARRSQYLYSQDLGSLKKPSDLKLNQTPYMIPKIHASKPTQPPNLYPPTD